LTRAGRGDRGDPLADLLDVQQNLPGEPLCPLPPKLTINIDGELLEYCHRATQIESGTNSKADARGETRSLEDKYNFPFCLKVSTTTPIDWGSKPGRARNHDSQAALYSPTMVRITLDELKALLDFTYQPQHYSDQGLDETPDYFDLNLIETFIAVSGVTGLEEGCYYYAQSPRTAANSV